MVKKVPTFLALILSLSISTIQATTVTLEVSDLEKTQDAHGNTINMAYVGDTITVTVLVSGGDRDTGTATVQGLDALHVLSQSHSTNIKVLNNNYSSDITYTYHVSLEQPGIFKLGPAQVSQTGGTIVKSNEITLQVVDDPAHKAQRKPQAAPQEPETIETTDKSAQPEVLCALRTTERDVVVGQPIELFLTIHARGPIREMGIRPPVFPGFTVKEIEKFTQKKETINSKEYDVREKKYILTALEPGTKEIPAIHIDYLYEKAHKQKRHRDFFFDNLLSNFFDGPQLARQSTQSKPLNLTINQLPPYTGNVDGVGQFRSFNATVDKPKATVNEAILLKLEIEGEGNLDAIPDLQLELPDFVKFYKSKTSVQESPDFSTGKKVFDYIVQVTKSGTAQIPAQEFTYFDITKKEYITLKTAPITLAIAPGQSTGTSPQKPKVIPKDEQPEEPIKQTQDINFIEEETVPTSAKSAQIPIWLFLLMLLAPVIFLNSTVIMRIKKYILSRHTHKKNLTDFQIRLETFLQKNDASRLYNFFLTFFAAKFNQNIALITEQYIESKLQELEWQPEKITEFLDFLNECASIAFIAHLKTTTDKQALLKKAHYWFLILNK